MIKLKRFWLLLLVATMCVAFTACGDDDKDEPMDNTVVKPVHSFVGIWLCDVDSWAFELKADGSGNEYLQEGNYPLYIENITWKYNASTQHLIIYGEDGEWRWDFEILEQSDKTFSAIESGGTFYSFHKRSNLSFLDNWQ